MPHGPIGETEHFWYRLGPPDKYIDSQRDNKAFARGEGRVWLSEDNGETWPHSLAFADADRITFSAILGNGNIVFATLAQLYLSTDNLQTCREITVHHPDGSPYPAHTPRDPERPGWYFHTIPGVNTFDVKGKRPHAAAEMLIWGNYCNVVGGAAPVNIYYSTDAGETVKLACSFGQSPYTHDDGSDGGGTEGTPLGDPDNPICCRHTHIVTYNPDEDAFYCCTGDHDKPEGFEVHWLRGKYDESADSWSWEVLLSDATNSRYKAGGITFLDGQLYWISDSNVREPFDRGIFRCAPEDLTHPERHTLLFNPEVESGNMIIQDGVILASHCAPASPMACGIIVSLDGGRTWAQHDLAELGRRSPCRFHYRNSDGWFRCDLRTGWVDFGEALFIKPKR